jgi:hypothetical protein
VQKAVLQYVNARPGYLAWRNNVGAVTVPARGKQAPRFVRFGFAGLPDVIGVAPGGRALFLEVKRPGETATPAQQAAIGILREAGAIAGVVRSLDDVQLVLWAHERGGL